MTKMPAMQKGMGASGMLFVLVVVITLGTVLFKLGPCYMSFYTMTSIMKDVAAAPEPIVGGKPAIMRIMESRMMVNNIRGVDAKSFTLKQTGDNTSELTVDYEQREHLFFNIDAVLTFHYTVVVKGR
ncbi:DUF4845 domain-containing protein [uncultured Thiodictyon sp.]|uniref:DUF4845 domain-containing protein n=1 Tax=uncultured Thiodictyon sp. TaxID=1846217 RepID=UPI0025ED3230|nr:DUF4845 domain-containing protein [uncultured Thiodictyon sp.]